MVDYKEEFEHLVACIDSLSPDNDEYAQADQFKGKIKSGARLFWKISSKRDCAKLIELVLKKVEGNSNLSKNDKEELKNCFKNDPSSKLQDSSYEVNQQIEVPTYKVLKERVVEKRYLEEEKQQENWIGDERN